MMMNIMNRMRAKILAAYILCFLTFVSAIKAQELDKILDALDKKDLGKSQTKEEVNKDPWLDPNSNLSKIFYADGRGVYSVLEWLGDLTDKEYKLTGKFHKKHNEYLSLKVNYLSKTKNQIHILSK